ncbi:MAG: hypothetical protein HYX78_02835 [Armatimonadetes bacterium]|nr:hypothetical protein [Armatimonadota bacterium]
MIPCKLTGLPFWKMYYGNEYPIWRAYADAVRFFGFDGWQIHGYLNYFYQDDQREFSDEVVSHSDGRFVVRTTCRTPAGDLWKETTYYDTDPPTTTRKYIKNLKEDLPKLKYMFPLIADYDPAPLQAMIDYSGNTAAVSGCIPVPGLHDLNDWFDGGLEAATYGEMDCPGEFQELVSWQAEHYLRMAEMMIDARPDFFMIGASGLYTLQSPALFRRYSLPVIRKMTRMSKEAGLPSFLHSCGKERELVTIFAEETDLDVVNPLEIPPMGDCDLGEIKAKYGHRLALMGNIHTTDVMLFGTPDKVSEECRKAIDAAAPGGGFILSTGDQCGRDTPFENIRAFVDSPRSYGGY